MERLIDQAIEIWGQGGWAMIALAVNALILFAVGAGMWIRMRAKGYRTVREKTWRHWITNPAERHGPVGELLDFVLGARDMGEIGKRFEELRAVEIAPFVRNLRFMKRAVSTAPLLGLLGTVTGMLATFQALSTGSGGDTTMDMVAGGISEALITTETGLVIALPGLLFQYYLTRQRDRYEAFLSHVETVCAQHLCRGPEDGLPAGAATP